MLSRVANNLYWMGRYLERTENLTRYMQVQYFSSLDAPLENQKELALSSVLHMAGLPVPSDDSLSEPLILVEIALEENQPVSIKSSVKSARENARGARDVISTELWQAINKFYRFVNDYPEDYFKTRGLYDYTQNVLELCAICKSRIQYSLLHDEVWAFVKMGMHLESAVQVTRMIMSKLTDIKKLQEMKVSKSVESFQWGTLLKSAEGFDMCRRLYKMSPTDINTLEFLILNRTFPRSISNNLKELQFYHNEISLLKHPHKDSIDWKVGRMKEYFKYLTIEELLVQPNDFLGKTLDYLYELNVDLEKVYLNY
ncbi:MAG: alpha-E domain-containing protein [Cyclobacteriaceae bacterium]|nr:alpha-E domain-containing protein [Cyclobacteriaceae bacterium]